MVEQAKKEPTEADLWAEMEAAEAQENPAKVDEFAEKPEKDNDAAAEGVAAPAQEPAPGQQQDPDLWADAPPDLKAAHDAQVRALESAQTEHARRSIEGRIASYTRRLQERNEAAAQPPQPAPDGEAADPLVELAAEYPEIAKPLEAKLAPIAERLSRFETIEQSRIAAADAQMDAELQANERMLEERHPGWDGFLKEYGPAFGHWIVDQPLYLRQAFVTNQEAIIDPYAAIDTLDAFKAFVEQNKQPPQNGQQPAPAAQPQGLNPRRAAQLAGSASPQSRGSRPTVSGIPEDGDPQAIWNGFRDIDPDEKKYRSA